MKVKLGFLVGVLLAVLSGGGVVAAFSDLPDWHQYSFALKYLQREGVIDGYQDGTVRPDAQINRAELIKILVEGRGIEVEDDGDCFPDVGEEWFAKYVCYAKNEGWVEGYSDGNFRPDQNVNRAEALKIIFEAMEVSGNVNGERLFGDVREDDWFAPYVDLAVGKALLPEGQGRFGGEELRTRGEVAEIIARIMQIQYMDDPVYTDWIRAEFETLLYLDELREANGVYERLELDPILTKEARWHSYDMAENIGDISHAGSDGQKSFERVKKYKGFEHLRIGENVGRGYRVGNSPIFKAVKRVHDNIFMPESEDFCNHRTTILSECLPFTKVGIGVYVKDGYAYFTEDFVTDEYVEASLPTSEFDASREN